MQKEERRKMLVDLVRSNVNDSCKRLTDDVERLSRMDDKELINWAYFYEGSVLMIYGILEFYNVNYRNNFDDNVDEHLREFFSRIKNTVELFDSNNSVLK